ncbi:MAG: cold shock domain-containing protein [archaeon]|nr:cold shock domain-containing protein [archaeon]
MPQGIVKWFNSRKGYGFITPEEGETDIFVHYTALPETGNYRTIYQGDKVEFNIEEGKNGPQASNVVVTEAAPRSKRGGYSNTSDL